MPKALSRRELLAGLGGSIAADVGTWVGVRTHENPLPNSRGSVP